MELFTNEELAIVADAIPEIFGDSVPPETEEGMNFLAESLLTMLQSTRSKKEKLEITRNFIKMAVCSGMLIQSRRINLDAIMYRDNTRGFDC